MDGTILSMNWLAHLFLSDDSIEYQLGNLLADLLKGKSWPEASPLFGKGLAMHKTIDAYTDQHPSFRQSKDRLGSRGLLKGVVIDITYDHLLAKHWDDYASMPLDLFIDRFHAQTEQVCTRYPESPRKFLGRLIRSGHLKQYHKFQGLENTLDRVDQRLSRRLLSRESASAYLPLLKQNLGLIEQDFDIFMPDLIAHFKSVSGARQGDHWLK